MSEIIIKHLPVIPVTQGPKHHFFGYFDKYPWNLSGRYLLSLETDFAGRQPEVGEKAGILLIDLENGCASTRIAETDAWCWQQGCMLQWLSDYPEDRIIYNDREGDHFVSRILDLKSGQTRTLCRPIYCLSPDGKWALSINFSRLDRERPGYGYPGGHDPGQNVYAPADDGIWLVDLQRNESRLVVSVDQITRSYFRDGQYGMQDTPGWFNHLLFSPDSRRFAFFHRWRTWKNGHKWHLTHMFTANIDGSDIYPLNLEDMSSHYTWIANDKIINFSNRFATGWQYHLFTDRTQDIEVIAKDVFPGDGHCSFSSDNKRMLTDCYPSAESPFRRLFLYDLTQHQAYEIGCFYSSVDIPAPTRCDLHPNWSRDNRSVCIDSFHCGTRQVYLIDVTPITGG
ncbi:MAG: hypothetical protein GX902_05115 [Lentisphaerae bacterium]|nr:hypothetical protein [Lentisphaerota bacterium]